MIDNLEFTKFVLNMKKMTPEEKNLFLEAVPNMTEEDKQNMVLSLGLQTFAEIYEDVSEVEDKAGLENKDIDAAVENYFVDRSDKIDGGQIEDIRSKLRSDIAKSEKTSNDQN